MESKFKVGDRVAVYAECPANCLFSTVDAITRAGYVKVVCSPLYYHPKQCRRLTKKPRLKYRGDWRYVKQADFGLIAFFPNGIRNELIKLDGTEAILKETKRK